MKNSVLLVRCWQVFLIALGLSCLLALKTISENSSIETWGGPPPALDEQRIAALGEATAERLATDAGFRSGLEREIVDLADADRVFEADLIIEAMRDFGTEPGAEALAAREAAESWQRQSLRLARDISSDCARAVGYFEIDTMEGLICKLSADFIGIGDPIDLAREGFIMANGGEPDSVILVLSALGLAATASTAVLPGPVTATTNGAAAVAKAVVRGGKVLGRFSRHLGRLVRSALPARSLKALVAEGRMATLLKSPGTVLRPGPAGRLIRYFGSFGRIAHSAGPKRTLYLMKHVETPADLARLEKVHGVFGKRTPGLYRLAGPAIKAAARTPRIVKSVVVSAWKRLAAWIAAGSFLITAALQALILGTGIGRRLLSPLDRLPYLFGRAPSLRFLAYALLFAGTLALAPGRIEAGFKGDRAAALDEAAAAFIASPHVSEMAARAANDWLPLRNRLGGDPDRIEAETGLLPEEQAALDRCAAPGPLASDFVESGAAAAATDYVVLHEGCATSLDQIRQ